MLGLSKLEAYGIIGLVIVLAAAAFGFYEHHEGYLSGKKEIQTEFDKFRNEVTAAGLKAQQDNLTKEKEYATNLANANAGRAVALGELQRVQAAASASRRASSNNPAAPAGSAYVCIESKAYNAAFQQFGKQLDGFIQTTRGLSGEGDAAQIDAESMIRAWPRSQPAVK